MTSLRKILVAMLLCIATSFVCYAQEKTFTLHGMVNPHYYADSRSVVGGREDMMLFFPKPIVLDSLNNDVNSGWNADMLSITARLGLRVNGPDIFNARTSAYIEADFTGATNATINNLRLRHAYINMQWHSSSLLAGQYWHPMVVHEIMPMTNPLNMGAPFHPYARYNQVRFDYHFGHLHAIATLLWQLDNVSQGLIDDLPASSSLFSRHNIIPESNLQIRYVGTSAMVGAAVNINTIRPLVSHSTPTHTSLSYSIYGRYSDEYINLRIQTLLNNSLYEICSLGGYKVLPDGSFQDWHFNTLWLDIDRSRGYWRPGLFLGYAVNSDFGSSNHSHLLGRGHDIETLWRIQPRLTYDTQKSLSFTAEAEYTYAAYTSPVSNLRLSLSMLYTF